jgi:hypothetical protein
MTVALLGGCKDHSEPVVYTIPKESPAPPPAAPMAAPVMDMARQQLPESALNQDGDNPAWSVPAGWEAVSGSAMRRASFSAPGSAGPVDIAVTSFPGDVGGLLANLNRWRDQIGAPALSAESVEDSIERSTVNGKSVIVSRIEGSGQSTHAAIFEHGGHSWFFKMTGPTASINEQADAFDAYINSIQFPDAP